MKPDARSPYQSTDIGLRRFISAFAFVVLLIPLPAFAELQNVEYDANDVAFPNPERGWYYVQQPGYASVTLPLNGLDFDALRTRNITMVRQVYVLDAWRERRLPDTSSLAHNC